MSEAPRDKLDAAMQSLAEEMATETGQAGAICTGWVVVAEWSTPDGEMWCSRWWAQHTPVWRRDGLLHHGLFGPVGKRVTAPRADAAPASCRMARLRAPTARVSYSSHAA